MPLLQAAVLLELWHHRLAHGESLFDAWEVLGYTSATVLIGNRHTSIALTLFSKQQLAVCLKMLSLWGSFTKVCHTTRC